MEIREADETDVAACFGLMRQLRPHLADTDEFVTRWRRQHAAGYRIAAAWDGAVPRGLTGFRIMENLIHGRFLYVDDLVCDADARRSGLGTLLMDWLKARATATGCSKLVLDTGLDNALAHRFYYRQGLLAKALRFNIELR